MAYEEAFTCKDGRIVRIVVDDFADYATKVTTPEGLKVGRFEFDFHQPDAPAQDYLLLRWAHLEGDNGSYVRQGIGRRILEIIQEEYGVSVTSRDDDGITRDDGSHLTGDAPAFVAAMRKRDLIYPLDAQVEEE